MEYTEEETTRYYEMKRKLDKCEKPRIWIYYLGWILALIPGVNIVGVIILAYVMEKVREVSLLYGYYGGRRDEITSSQTMYEDIKGIVDRS